MDKVARDKVARYCASALALTIMSGCARQAPMVCPTVQAGGSGDLRETRDQQRAAAAALGEGSENEIASTAAVIRGRHPTAGTDEIANAMVVAYCAKIAARPDLDANEKDQRLAAFAERVRQVVGDTMR